MKREDLKKAINKQTKDAFKTFLPQTGNSNKEALTDEEKIVLESALKKYLFKISTTPPLNINLDIPLFTAGAAWQKKEIKPLIEELIYRLKCTNTTLKAMKVGKPGSYNEAAQESIDLNLSAIEKANKLIQ